MNKKKWEFNLDLAGIDACVETIQGISKEYLKGVPQSGSIAFSMELILLNFQKHFGEDNTFELEMVDRFGRVNLYLKVKGESFDPRVVSQDTDEDDEFASIMLNKYSGDAAEYKYDRGINVVHRSIKKKAKLSPGVKIVIGLGLGVLLGLLGQLLSVQTQETLALLLDTINGIVLDLIVMGATLVVFMMVVNSISGFGNVATVKKSGSSILKNYLLSYLLAILFFLGYIFLFFNFTIDSGSGSGGSILSIFTETIAGIFPQSSLSPFVDCNFLQIIFLAVMIGIAMLVIGDRTKPVKVFCESFEGIANQILDWFCALIPLFVFTMIPSLIWRGQLAEMAGALVHLLGVAVAASMVFVIRFAVMCIRLKISPAQAFRILRPAMLHGLVTCSTTASLAQIQEAIKNLKVKNSFNSFSTAMGLIFEIATIAQAYTILSFYILLISGVPITVSTIVSLIIISILLAVATPPVSGGVIAVELIIVGMFNVPDTYLALIPPFMLIFDFFNTFLRCGGIIITSATSAQGLGEAEG